jgi:hypothetical protein
LPPSTLQCNPSNVQFEASLLAAACRIIALVHWHSRNVFEGVFGEKLCIAFVLLRSGGVLFGAGTKHD